jgi:hypothetical protein
VKNGSVRSCHDIQYVNELFDCAVLFGGFDVRLALDFLALQEAMIQAKDSLGKRWSETQELYSDFGHVPKTPCDRPSLVIATLGHFLSRHC